MTTAAAPLSGTYTVDPVHSSFGFAVRYQGVSIFKGTLDEVQATLANGRLEGVAKVESISIRSPEQFRAHVLGEEFFDAANHPEVTFTSSTLDVADGGAVTVEGDLTIKGITNPVTASGTWTYIDGVAGSGSAAQVCSTVIDLAINTTKSTTAPSTLGNIGQYTAADGGASSPYPYPGD